MPEDIEKKAPSLGSIFDQEIASQDVTNWDTASHGKSIDFNSDDIDRYLSYSTKTFGKLGYDPLRDNSKYYNENTHWSEDLHRAYHGMFKLAGVGFRDTFGFGVTASKESHKDFEKVMSDWSSTRGGATGFISNTMVSSGYTVGIMAAIAAEEAVLALATGGLGLVTAPGEIGRGLFAAGKAVKKYDQYAGSVGKAIKGMSKIENARMVKLGDSFKTFAKQLLPAQESMDFLRNVDSLTELNKFQRTLQGAGAVARDARKIHLTMSESKLEASMARDETRDELIQEWYSNNAGKEMDDKTLASIDEKANEIYDITYNSNLALIYTTNAITFNSMFKSMRLTNKSYGTHQAGLFNIKNLGSTDVVVEALKKNLFNNIRSKIPTFTKSGLLDFSKQSGKWLLGSSMEGVQEIGQDTISGFAKRFVAGDQKLRGQWYESLLDSMGDMHAESFFSGMLMGTFASPVGMSIQKAQQFTIGKGYKAITDRKAWKEANEKAWKQQQEDAKLLTEYFQETGSFLDVSGEFVFEQAEAQQRMADAAANGDRKTFEDERSEVFRKGMIRVLKNNLEGEYLEHLRGMKNYTATELNESTGRTDITEENKAEFLAKVDKKINDIQELKKIYDEAQQQVNPVSMKGAKITDPDFLEKSIAHHAFEQYRNEIIFTKDKLRDLGQRTTALGDKFVKDGVFTRDDLNIMTDRGRLSQEIKLLQQEIKSDKEYDVNKEDLAKKESRLQNLKDYKNALTKFDALQAQPKGLEDSVMQEKTEEAHAEMKTAFNKIADANMDERLGPSTQIGYDRPTNDQRFVELWDYLVNNKESKYLQGHVNTLLDQNYGKEFVVKASEVLRDIEANKKQHIQNSLEKLHNMRHSEAMIDELLTEGIMIDMNELDALIENRIMPTKLYDVASHKPLKKKEYMKAQEIINRYVKNLKGKRVIAKDTDYVSRKKFEDDTRTAKGLVREFASSKMDEPVNIKTFINRLLRSKQLTITEKEILNVLKEQGITDGKVILTDSADAPISINDKGVLTIDVRFAASDFKNEGTPFEYLAVSALLQQHFANQLKNNSALESDVKALMKKAADAFVEQNGDQSARAMTLFNDPVQFLSESLNNISFQNFLAEVEDVESPEADSLWDKFMEALRRTLSIDFKGTLLDRSVALAQLALTDEAVDATTAQTEPTVEPTTDVEEEVDEKLTERDEIESKIEALDEEISQLEKQKGTIRFKLKTNRKIKNLKLQRLALKEELRNLPKEKTEVAPTVVQDHGHKKTTDSSSVKTSDGETIISNNTPFRELPLELQERLADLYSRRTDPMRPAAKPKLIKRDKEGDAEKAAADFEKAGKISENTTPPKSALDALTDEDIKAIEGNMKTNVSYIKAIADFNTKKNTPQGTVNPKDSAVDQERIDRIANIILKEGDPQEVLSDEDFQFYTDYETLIDDRVEELAGEQEQAEPEIGEGVVVVDNASDNMEVFGDFVMDDVASVNDPAKQDYIEDLIQIGRDLDNGTITAKIGNLRAQVAGRLIVDVITSDGRRFLMYRSTGTGTTADTQGEWTPIPGFAKNGWFIKVRDENGNDPKFSKYNIKTFQEIAQVIKQQEGPLFETPEETGDILQGDLEKLIPGVEQYLSDEEMIDMIMDLNAGDISLEEIAKLVAERKANDASAQFEERKENLTTNLAQVRRLKEGAKVEINRKLYSISKADVLTFMDLYEGIEFESPEQFNDTLNYYIIAGINRAKVIRNSTLEGTFENMDNLYQEVLTQIRELKESKVISSKIVSALNRKLQEAGADFTIKNIVPSKQKGLTVAYGPVKIKKTLQRKEPVLPADTLSDYWSEQKFDEDRALFMIYDWLRENKVHPDAIPGGEKRTYTSKKSTLPKAFDEIAALIFADNMEELESLDGAESVVENAFTDYEDLTSMKSYLNDRMEFRKSQEEEEGPSQKQREKEREEELKYKAEKRESAISDYYGSVAFLIESGQYEGDPNELTPEERKLYNQNLGLYEGSVQAATPIQTEVYRISEEFANETKDQSLNEYVKSILERINSENVELKELVAMHRILSATKLNLTPIQKSKLQSAVFDRLTDQDFVYATVVMNGIPYRIEPTSTVEMIYMSSMDGTSTVVMPIDAALSQMEDILEDGSEYAPTIISEELTKENGNLLKAAYSEVFNNLADIMDKASDLNDNVLKAKIAEELNNCK